MTFRVRRLLYSRTQTVLKVETLKPDINLCAILFHSSCNEKFKTIEPSLEHRTPLTLFPLLAFGNEWLINSWSNVMHRTHRWRGGGDKWATLRVRWAFNQTKRPPCGLPSHHSALPWIFPRQNKITGRIFWGLKLRKKHVFFSVDVSRRMTGMQRAQNPITNDTGRHSDTTNRDRSVKADWFQPIISRFNSSAEPRPTASHAKIRWIRTGSHEWVEIRKFF